MVESVKVDYFSLSKLLAFQAPIICLIVCIYIFIALRKNGISRMQFRLFRIMTVCCVGLMLGEVSNGILLYEVIESSNAMILLSQNLCYWFSAIGTAAFCEFCIAELGMHGKLMPCLIRISYFLTAFVLAARIALIKTDLFSFVGENGEIGYGPLDDLQLWLVILTNVLLLILLTVHFADKNAYINHERYRKLLVSSALMTAVFLLYALFYLPYVTWIGNMFMLLYLFSSLKDLMIDRDELTSLSNRRRMLKDLGEKCRDSSTWSYILADVNSFKQINDTYGHKEGDRSLIIVATALKRAALRNGADAYRIGGDEFSVLLPAGGMEIAVRIGKEAEAELAALIEEENLSYTLQIALGCVSHEEDPTLEIPDVLEIADQRMYEDKKIKKAHLPDK